MGGMKGAAGTTGAWIILWRCPGGVLVARVLSSGRHSTGPRRNPATESPGGQEARDALRLCYANGEISRDLQGKVKLGG
jgi:hypothetical protein